MLDVYHTYGMNKDDSTGARDELRRAYGEALAARDGLQQARDEFRRADAEARAALAAGDGLQQAHTEALGAFAELHQAYTEALAALAALDGLQQAILAELHQTRDELMRAFGDAEVLAHFRAWQRSHTH